MSHRMVALWIVAAGLVAGGCSTTSRYVTTEHWHDSDTFFVAYTEYAHTDLLVTSTGESSAHVRLCRAGPNNQVQCQDQVAVDRLLNPDEEYPEPPPPPPPAPAEPAEAPAAEPDQDAPDTAPAS